MSCTPVCLASSVELAAAVNELGARCSQPLDTGQKEQLNHLLQEYVDIFAAQHEDCTGTGLVQHHIETGEAVPIRLQPHRLPLAKRQAAEDSIRSMAANGIIEPLDISSHGQEERFNFNFNWKDGGWPTCGLQTTE